MKVQNATNKLVPIDELKVNFIHEYNGGNATYMEVSGKGKLYLAATFKGWYLSETRSSVEVFIDGKKFFNFGGFSESMGSEGFSGFYSFPILKGFSFGQFGPGSQDPFMFNNTVIGALPVLEMTEGFRMKDKPFVYYTQPNENLVTGTTFIHENPISFDKSLKVQVTSGADFGIAVAYTLE